MLCLDVELLRLFLVLLLVLVVAMVLVVALVVYVEFEKNVVTWFVVAIAFALALNGIVIVLLVAVLVVVARKFVMLFDRNASVSGFTDTSCRLCCCCCCCCCACCCCCCCGCAALNSGSEMTLMTVTKHVSSCINCFALCFCK